MEEIEFYKKISVRVNNGTGCIFIPSTKEYAYVLTVRHNIENKENQLLDVGDIKVINNTGAEINVLDSYVHPNDDRTSDQYVDLALLKIETPKEIIPQYYYSDELNDNEYRIFGYPKFKNGDYSSFKVEYDLIKRPNIDYHIKSIDSLATFSAKEGSTVTGFSGSGIFYENNGIPVLKGIFPCLDDPNATFGNLNAYYPNCFNTIIRENNLAELIPESLKNFDQFIDKTLLTLEPEISNCFSSAMQNVLKAGISPHEILEHLKGMIFIPAKKDYKSHALDGNIWVGWLELLLLYVVFKEEDSISLAECLKEYRMYYSTSEDPNINVFIKRVFGGEDNSISELYK